MAFVSWTQMLADFKDALAERRYEQWFLSSVENSKQMRTTFTKLPNIVEMEEWLEAKASEEVGGFSNGNIPFSIGGY